ncbi:flagellin lysine-N-methylase [Clostridium saccharoperbutylacetonicum]|uniref:flagellin lysine-N-methylase n=1 Tax=Clostridium saccharoperbutylacetonicum TaxID=36745 RepID=UPI000983D64A|nr:flagellin lysine-N-methylase [Clostridium saccharoperbutylacetonicum]AQR94890.1 flagellar biosynthetic protein FliU [Clostridium saccharoperbutylacetonicum]NSB30731.1 lysine-N-methylase [Clostridium saccharoperbutylacetonicum]
MKTIVPHYYKDFKCIASKCTDTCCAGWEIIIDEKTNKHYKKVCGEFGERLKANLTLYEDGESGFILKNNNCPFLNKNNLCDIYTELGEESLCYTCKTYPRFIEEYSYIREIGISLSCPEAARLILKDSKPITFDVSEDNELIDIYDDINFDISMELMSARKVALDMLQNHSIAFKCRIALLINFAHDIQGELNKNNLTKITEIVNNYSKELYQKELISQFNKYKTKQSDKYHNMGKCMNIYRKLNPINDNWPKIIENAINCFYKINDVTFYEKQYNAFNEYYKNNAYEYENLMIYFIFQYFMKAIFDEELYSKVTLAVMSYLVIKELNVVRWIDNNYNFDINDQIDITHMYSKEIENSEKTLYDLEETFNTSEIFDLKKLLILIMN